MSDGRKPPAQRVRPANKVLSNAGNTSDGKEVAISLFDEFQDTVRSGDSPLQELTLEDVANENMTELVTAVSNWMSYTPIRQHNSTNKMIGSTSLGQYFGRIVVLLEERFPDHEAWGDKSWTAQLKAGVIANVGRRERSGEDDFKDPKIRSLYKSVSPSLVRASQRDSEGWDELQGADLESILKSMIRKAGRQNPKNFQFRAIIVATALGVGRGGEAKFLRYDSWLYDHYYESPDSLWHQLKTTIQTPLLWAPEMDGYLVDFYHAFTCYFIVEHGLHRDPNMSATKKKYVFPDLHEISNNYVTTKITKVLREHCHDSLKESTSAKSLRRGFNTFLAAHRQVTSEEQRVRGAWSSGVTSDKYTENCPALTLPAAVAFGGWPDVHEHVYPPRIECLQQFPGELESVHRLMDALYIVSVPQLQVGGQLRPFLHTCTAVAIMNHPRMEAEYGTGNPMVAAMIKAAESANIVSPSATGTSANSVLHSLAKVIHSDFEGRNQMNPTTENMSTVQAVHTLSLQMQGMAGTLRRSEEERLKLTRTLHQQVEAYRSLESKMDMILSEIQSNKRVRSHDAVPSTPSPSKRQRQHDESPVAGESLLESTPPPAQHSLPSSPVDTVPTAAVAANAQGTLLSTETPLFQATVAGSSKEIHVSTLLRDLFVGGRLASGTALPVTQLTYVPRENKHLYKATMELVEKVLTIEHTKLLRTSKDEIDSVGTSVEFMNALTDIETKCLAKMAELEGRENVGKTKSTMTGLGARHIAWKKKNQPVQTTTTIKSMFMRVKEALSPSKK